MQMNSTINSVNEGQSLWSIDTAVGHSILKQALQTATSVSDSKTSKIKIEAGLVDNMASDLRTNVMSATTNAIDQVNASEAWGSQSISNTAWDSGDSNAAVKSDNGTGWGSPSSTPVSSAGTEAWAQGGGSSKPVQAWGVAQDAAKLQSTDWPSTGTDKAPASSTTWNHQPAGATASWGDNESKSSDTGSFDGQPDVPNQGNSIAAVWGTDTTTSNSGGATEATASSSTNRAITSSWGGNTSNPLPSAQSGQPRGAWDGGSPFGSKQPGSWPQNAAGRAVTSEQAFSGHPASDAELAKEKIIAAAVNSADGWGKGSIRQDTDWTTEEPAQPPPRRRGSSDEEAHWNPNSNGTAIWEAAKDAPSSWVRSHSRSSSTSSGGNEWNDSDNGTWVAPPRGNEYRGPPPTNPPWANKADMNNWERQASGGPPVPPVPDNNTWIDPNRPNSAQWRGTKPDNGMWPTGTDTKTDDNMWDRDGTKAWDKTETGSWQNKPYPSITGPAPPGPSGGQWWRDGASGPNQRAGSGWDATQNNSRPGDGQYWPDNQNTGMKKWPDDNNSGRWTQQQPPLTNSASSSTWVNPTPPPNPNISMDGTHIWKQKAANSSIQQSGAPGAGNNWNGTEKAGIPTQWGTTTGAKPKNLSSQWTSDTNRKMDDGQHGWGDEPRDDSDVGNWVELPDSNHSWSSATRDWSKVPEMPPHRPQNAMRSKMLQQLTDLGFKKEDAQNALIKCDMNYDQAKAMLEDQEKSRHETNMTYVTNVPTAFSSATLPPANSFLPVNRQLPGANILQQKLLQQQPAFARQPISAAVPAQLPATPQTTGPSQTQQAVHQQIVQQLRSAVQAGLINPQLLNQQLTPTMLVTLQQLLQLQNVLQRLIAQERSIHQNKSLSIGAKQDQIQKMNVLIARTKQQILHSQAQISLAQQSLPKPVDHGMKNLDLSGNLANLHLQQKKDAIPTVQTAQLLKAPTPLQQQLRPSQPAPSTITPVTTNIQQPTSASLVTSSSNQNAELLGSRLSKWKLTPDKEDPPNLSLGGKLPVSSTPTSLSTANSPFLSTTWSSSDPSKDTATWPTTMPTGSVTALSTDDALDEKSQGAPNIGTTASNDAITSLVSSANVTSTTTESIAINPTSTSSEAEKEGSSSHSMSNSPQDKSIVDSISNMIEEFVPGKKWQGPNIKNPEEDPNVTPGEAMRPWDLSTSGMGRSSSSTSVDTWGTDPKGSAFNSPKSTWSSAGTDGWGNSKASTRTPPGFTDQNKQPNWSSMNRSMSYTPGDRFAGANQLALGGTSIIIGNPNHQIDIQKLSDICGVYGTVQSINECPQGRFLVSFQGKEAALNALKGFNGQNGFTAEFVGDGDHAKLAGVTGNGKLTSGSESSGMSSLWSPATSIGDAEWNGSSMFTSSSNAWSSGNFEDQNVQLPGTF